MLANHYQHLLQMCLTAVAADMNNYCPANSSTEVAGQFPSHACLSFYTSCKSAKAQAEVRAGEQVSGDQLFMSAVIVGIKT